MLTDGTVIGSDHILLGARVRVEHRANALHSGPAAAEAIRAGIAGARADRARLADPGVPVTDL